MAIGERDAERLRTPEPPVVAAGPRSRLAGIVSPRTLVVVYSLVVAVCVLVAAVSSSADQWRDLGLIAVLALYMLLAEFGGVALPGDMEGSVSTLGLALAITFLYPAPAVAVAVVPVTLESLHRRVPPVGLAGNVALYAFVTLASSLAIGALFGEHPPDVAPRTLLLVAAALVVVDDHLSFVWVALIGAIVRGASMRVALRRSLVPLIPFHLVSAAFTGAAAVVYVSAGLAALAILLAGLIVSARLVRVITVAEAREQQVAELAIARARLLGEALTAEERERVRLAGEIHDDALQELALAQLELREAAAGNTGALERAGRSLEAAVASLRNTLSRIVPAAEMRTGGLSTVLETMAADLCEPAGVAWAVSVEPELDDSDPTLVASMARELVTNAVKHAHASRVQVDVRRTPAGERLEVRDDGRGFEDAGATEHGHFGLTLVENRARAAGGGLEIRSTPGGGSVVAVQLG
jgi:two-component system NarL family sensor kinase